MAWKNIPEKKVLATLKDGKSFKGAAAEKMTIYVDGEIPGSEGDVKGVSVTVDPSTYVMTTQLKDGKGGDVGSPATVDLPLESMVVGGEYDDATKKVILTLKNGETVEFSVADLVAGLQSEITPQNPLSADLVAETSNKNFVTSEEKSDIDTIPGLTAEIDDVRQALDDKQDIIDENNPLNADYIDDENSDKKLVTPEEKEDISSISGLADDVATLNTNVEGLQSDVSGLNDDVDNLEGDVSTLQSDVSTLQSDLDNKQDTIDENNPLNADYIDDGSSEKKLVTREEEAAIGLITAKDVNRYAEMDSDTHLVSLGNNYGDSLEININHQNDNREPVGVNVRLRDEEVELLNGQAANVSGYADDTPKVNCPNLPAGTYYYDANSGVTLYVDYSDNYAIDKSGTFITGQNSADNKRIVTFIPDDGSPTTVYEYDANDDTVVEKPLGSSGESVVYFNAESSGYLLNVENIAFYKDAQLTEEMTPSEMFQLTNKGPVNLIGMFDDGSEFIPWSSEIIVSAADDGMDGQGDSFFFRVLEGATTGTVAYYSNKWHIGDKIIFLTASEVDGLVKKGSGAPTTSTTGEKGQLYEDTTNGKVYICTGRSGSTYTWKEVIKSGDNISGLNNDAGYQNASQVSSAIASAVGEITSFEYEVVQTLPATGEAGKIYLVANSGTTPNIYDEYIWVNNAFEKIGTTEMDLSNYYTKTQTDTLLGAKADQSTTYTKTEVDTALGNKADSSNVYTKTQVDTALGNKANSSDVYSKSEVDTALAGKVDAVDPADLPSGAYQGSVVVTDDKENIDPSSVEEGQIVVDPTTKVVYVISKETEPGTTTETLVFTEVGKEQVVFLPMTITDLQALTFSMDNTVAEVNTMINAGMSVFYRLVLPQAVSGLQAGTYDFRPFYSSNAAILCSMVGASSTNTIMGVAWHTASGTPYLEMRSLQNQITSSNKLSADLIDNSTSDNKTYETGTGAPTTSTAGSVGELYVDKSTGTVYVCTDNTGGTYTWSEVSGGDGAIITMTSTDPGEGATLEENHFIAVYEV